MTPKTDKTCMKPTFVSSSVVDLATPLPVLQFSPNVFHTIHDLEEMRQHLGAVISFV